MFARLGSFITFAVLGTVMLPASAAIQWKFADSSGAIAPVSSPASVANCGLANSTTFGNCETWHATPSTGPDVDVRAYSNTATSPTANSIDTAYLGMYSGGLGVSNKIEGINVSSPNHAIDNYQQTDSVLLSFKSTINLTGVVIGWPTSSSPSVCSVPNTSTACDTDITIWAYTAAGALNTATNLATKTYAGLTSAGWTLVGSYANLVNGTTKLVNGATTVDNYGASSVESKYWLISAYVGSALTTGDDFIKLQSVYGGSNGKVPEPGSLALLLLAMVGGVWIRRAKSA